MLQMYLLLHKKLHFFDTGVFQDEDPHFQLLALKKSKIHREDALNFQQLLNLMGTIQFNYLNEL